MSHKYYGSLVSDTGHKFIQASAQTWDGSVTVLIENGMVDIQVAEGSRRAGRTLINVMLEDLIKAKRMVIHSRD